MGKLLSAYVRNTHTEEALALLIGVDVDDKGQSRLAVAEEVGQGQLLEGFAIDHGLIGLTLLLIAHLDASVGVLIDAGEISHEAEGRNGFGKKSVDAIGELGREFLGDVGQGASERGMDTLAR